jgi:hypothetical protein
MKYPSNIPVKNPPVIDAAVGIRPSKLILTQVYIVYYISIPTILRIYNKYMQVRIIYMSIMVSTMKIGEETKKSLLKIGAEHTLKDGKERSLEDIVKILIEEHKIKQK